MYVTVRSAAASFLLLFAARVSLGQSGAAKQCSLDWRNIDTLYTRIGAPVAVSRAAPPVRSNGKLLLVGAEVTFGFALAPDPVPPPTSLEVDPSTALGVTVDVNGLARLVQRPLFLNGKNVVPLAFSALRGGLHLVWSEDISRDQSVAKKIFYSKFDGVDWSPPELAMSADHIAWEIGIADVRIVDDQPIVVAPGFDRSWHGILIARRTKAGWRNDRLPVRAPFPPSGIAFIERDSQLGIAYRDQVDSRSISAANLYVRMLLAKSGRWGSETVARALADADLNWPQSVRTTDGVTHLFWMHQRPGEVRGVVGHVSSRDLKRWNYDSLVLQNRLLGLSIATSGRSSVAIVLQGAAGSPLQSTVWNDGRFMAPLTHSNIAPTGTAPLIIADGLGLYRMFWLAMTQFEYKKNVITFPVTATAVAVSSC